MNIAYHNFYDTHNPPHNIYDKDVHNLAEKEIEKQKKLKEENDKYLHTYMSMKDNTVCNTKYMISVMQQFICGKVIEEKEKNKKEGWNEVPYPCWNWEEFEYRVKE